MKQFLQTIKKLTKGIAILLFLISAQLGIAQVTYTGNITLDSQTAVDTFINASHPYSYINGRLSISGSDINDLTPLLGLDSIGSRLYLQDLPNLTSLHGLNNLKKVGDLFAIINIGVSNMEGLNNLESIGSFFSIVRSSSIVSLDGLENLNYVGDYIQLGHESNSFFANANLEDFCAVSDLLITKFQEGLCTINFNKYDPTLQDLLNGDCSPPVVNDIYYGNVTFATQTAIDTFRNEPHAYHKIVGNVMIYNYNSSEYINNLDGLLGIDTIVGNVDMTNSYSLNYSGCILDISGLNSIQKIDGDLKINSCRFLKSLNGLNNLNYIGGKFQLRRCRSLKTLDGLENLSTVTTTIEIGDAETQDNDSLNDYCAISDLLIQKYQEGNCTILYNAYCPTLQDLLNGDCAPPVSNDIYYGNLSFSTQTAIDTFRNEPHTYHKIVGNVTIDNNIMSDFINNLNGLLGIDTIAGDLDITNQYIQDEGTDCYITNVSGLDSIQMIDGDLKIHACKFLQNLNGLENLNYIGDMFLLTMCPSLKTLDGLENLSTVTTEVQIGGTESLGNDSLENYCAISDLLIQKYQEGKCTINNNFYNPLLSDLQAGNCYISLLSGTVTISGDLQYGQELTANVSGSNNSGTLSYQWKRSGDDIEGATSGTYTLTEADISYTISVEITSSVETGSISSSETDAIEKADQSAPSAPTLSDKTYNSINLNSVEGCEYRIGEGEWQSSTEFTGLTPETNYSLTQRYAETATHKVSPASDPIIVTTDVAPVNELSGTVTISGTLQYGQELTASVTGSNNTGILSYQWKRNGINISGANSDTYILTESDISYTISVEVTSSVETGSISSSETDAIEKADQSAPSAPTLSDKTYNSINLNSVEGCEYRIGEGEWQSSTEFTGLTPGTSYSLTQRYAETTTYKASPASDPIIVTTDVAPVNELSGTVTISGTLQYGQELTASVTGSNNTGILSYQWKRNGINISGANSDTYILTESDISYTISVEVTSSVETGSISSSETDAIEKADQSAPSAPTLSDKTYNSINLNSVEGCEYRIGEGEWQSSTEFTGLTPGTSYSLTQRYAETTTYKASPASDPIIVTTDVAPVNEPSGTVTISGTLQYGQELTASVTGSNNTGILSYQWKRNGINISGANSDTYILTESDISYTISVEVTSSVETGSISSSETDAIEKADQSAPSAPTLSDKTYNSINLNSVEGCEYRIGEGEWQSSTEFTGLTPGTSYSLTQRYAETSTHHASPTSDPLSVTTNASSVNQLSGTVTISGTLQYGQELTLSVSESNNTGTLSYQWKRSGDNIENATSEIYTLTEADISYTISVEVTSSVEIGGISSSETDAIEKADQSAPSAPTLAEKTYNSINLNAVDGCEYRIGEGEWQTSIEFTGLTSETEYSCFQRYLETATHKVSEASEALMVTTNSTTGINSIEYANLKYYPNPVKDILHLTSKDNFNDINCRIYNSLGELVKVVILNNQLGDVELDLSDLHQGLYLIQIESKHKKGSVIRILKE